MTTTAAWTRRPRRGATHRVRTPPTSSRITGTTRPATWSRRPTRTVASPATNTTPMGGWWRPLTPTNTTWYGYDDADELTSVVGPDAGPARKGTSYAYDKAGNPGLDRPADRADIRLRRRGAPHLRHRRYHGPQLQLGRQRERAPDRAGQYGHRRRTAGRPGLPGQPAADAVGDARGRRRLAAARRAGEWPRSSHRTVARRRSTTTTRSGRRAPTVRPAVPPARTTPCGSPGLTRTRLWATGTPSRPGTTPRRPDGSTASTRSAPRGGYR